MEKLSSGPNQWIIVNVNGNESRSLKVTGKDNTIAIPLVKISTKELIVVSDKGGTGIFEISSPDNHFTSKTVELTENGKAVFILLVLNDKTNEIDTIVALTQGFNKTPGNIRTYFINTNHEYIDRSVNFKYRYYSTSHLKQPANTDFVHTQDLDLENLVLLILNNLKVIFLTLQCRSMKLLLPL